MKKAFLVAFLTCALAISAFACGKERWPVKVLTDADRHLINRAPTTITVADAGALAGPSNQERTSKNGHNHRLADPEKTTYTLKAILLGYRLESDGDFHLVLKDPNSDATMIAEIPDPGCITDPTLSKHADSFRQALVVKFGAPGKKTKRLAHPAKVTLRGVGFFDIEHGTEQDGKAPNNLELHPVLGLSLGAS